MSKVSEEDELNFKKQDIIRGLASQGYIIDQQTKEKIEQLSKEKIDSLGTSYNAGNGVTGYSPKVLTERFETELLPEFPSLSSQYTRVLASSTVHKALEGIYASGINVRGSQAKMIVDKLSPALAELDPEYLKQHSEIIAGQIQKAVLEKSMVTSSALGGLYIRERNLDKISIELSDGHLDASDNFQASKIKSTVVALSAQVVAQRLGELGAEKARATKYDLNSMTLEDLAKMRRENRELFDRTVLHTEPKASATVETSRVIDQVVTNLINSGVKLSEDQHKALKAKLKEKLEPTLSKLEPEYLKTNSSQIASVIHKELYDDRSIGYSLGLTSFSVSDKSLDNVSKGIHSNHQKASDDFERRIVDTGIGTATQSLGAQLEERLKKFAQKQAEVEAVRFTKKELTVDALLQMRKEDPKMFDKVVRGVKKEEVVAKHIVTSEQEKTIAKGKEAIEARQKAEQEKAAALPLTPPPLLSEALIAGVKPQEGASVQPEGASVQPREEASGALRPSPTPPKKVDQLQHSRAGESSMSR